ncbi:glutamate ABC transporter substrate-binding protein [Phycicoccus endophyticus]|uniref:Glutamate ABC transporter substrate-binding protein n=1 Tax=Phycicoccus endophyticus TaxID=1690220 RepID=A0A7G9R3Y4_9MICO|nr:glutamate ABC transporter substrate-binding protein [Phycicoccus endophyticus]NHI18143.1 glutamate ABC transporter substrate-binding protein [Phycicoccus endophyticus]QNN50309.1 glutamate ABC transporter substrate-binding protein [Phycicoccus endophyticus]GGL26114.1 glutamate-binding protein [Phycicoccus endophyticus]
MKSTRIGLVATAAALALTASACGSDDSGDGGSGGDGIKIGIKFDQPGLGLKQGNDYTGMDVDVATYVAGELGHDESDIEWVQAPSSQRETLISTGQVDLVVATYSITDERKESVSFAGPYFVAGQDLLVRSDDDSITGPDSLEGKKLCSVTGSTSAQNVSEEVPGVNLQEFGTYSECVAALVSGAIDALTTDDTILAGYAAQDQYEGKLKVVGAPFSEERYGIGLKKGDTELCQQVTDAITKMIDDGDWQTIVDDNLGPAGYEPPAGNPPTPDACS